MGVNQVKFGNATVMDISDSTVAPETLLSGVSAYNKAGNKITGEVVVEHVEVEPVLETGTKSASITVGEESADIYCENTKAEVKNMKTTQSATIANKIAQFECIDKNFVKLLKLAMEPIQDLHGYDHPWVGGAGKNKLNLADNYAIDSEAGVNISPSIASNIPVKGGVTYTLSCYQRDAYTSKDPTKTRYTLSVRGLDGKNIYEDEASNPQLTPHQHYITFTPEVDQTVGFIIWIQYTSDDCRFEHFMLEVSSTPTEWAPYSNICPISGRTEASVTRTGTNQWDEEWEKGSIDANTGEPSVDNARVRSKNFTKIYPNTEYYALPNVQVFGYDENYSYIGVQYAYTAGGTFTTSNNCYYIKIRTPKTYGGTYKNDLGVNYPSTVTAYEPHDTETHTHQYSETIYGGSDDFVNGGLMNEWSIAEYDGTEKWGKAASATWDVFYVELADEATGLVDDICSDSTNISVYSFSQMVENAPCISIRTNLTPNRLHIAIPNVSTVDECKAYLAEHNLQVCYKKATPATIQTSAEKITTLPGVNVISATEPISECSYRVLEENLSDTIYSNETLVGEDSDVYAFRTAPDISDANYVEEKIIGGSVAFNQLVQNGNFADTSNWAASYGSLSVSNNKGTLTLTSQNTASRIEQSVSFPSNHKFYISFDLQTDYASSLLIQLYGTTSSNIFAKILSANTKTRCEYVFATSEDINTLRLYTNRNNVGVANNTAVFENIRCYDLTAMFGSAVADYIYNLENTTAGSGVAFLKKYGFLTRDYYDYNTGSLLSVNFNKWFKTSKNLFNLHRLQGVVNIIDGNDVYVRLQKNSQQFFHDYKSYIPGNRTYTFIFDPPSDFSLTYAALRCRLKDNSDFGNVGAIDGWTYQSLLKNYRQSFENASHVEITVTIPDCLYCEFGVGTNNSFENIKETGTYVKFSNIQLEVGSEATDYEPYEGYEISLDDNLDLRGLFRIVDNELVADGDIYEGDGKITRKYGVVDLGDFTWVKHSTEGRFYTQFSSADNAKPTSSTSVAGNILCLQYSASSQNNLSNGKISIDANPNPYINIIDLAKSDLTAEDFKTAMSGIKLLYELAEPILNRGTNFDSPQVFIPNGNEYFVKTYDSTPDRDIDIPAGHVGKYYGKSMFKEISLPTIPKSGGTYILKCNVLADGNKKLYWCADSN